MITSKPGPTLKLPQFPFNFSRKMLLASTALSAAVIGSMIAGCASAERDLLFYPTHHNANTGLPQWKENGTVIGYVRPVQAPRTIWLMLHGNGGQADDRTYALPHFAEDDTVYIMEYPGYGNRAGVPSTASFNEAARQAYLSLRTRYPGKPVCVVSESIGSGPASTLAALPVPPEKIVLIVPFDQLSLVAKDHLPVSSGSITSVMQNDWNNIAALAGYKAPVDIFGAQDDEVIPVSHAKALAAALPQARFTLIAGGHNDWSNSDAVKIRNP